MLRHATLLVALLAVPLAGQVPLDKLEDGMRITESVRVEPVTYRLSDKGGGGAIIISGNDITVDFRGAVLEGSGPGTSPDRYSGVCIVIEDARSVTIRNLVARGWKVAVLARRCRDIEIVGCDFSDNWRQRLKSTPDAADPADRLAPLVNDGNEWLEQGAGVYLDTCVDFTLYRNRVHNGQNGICVVRSESGAVYDNDIAFMSGWGIAFYRSSNSVISNNRTDWCVRAYEHGVYADGGESGGILLIEQCSKNIIAFNSATHCGDGIRIYAGEEVVNPEPTMLRITQGLGGSNDNLVHGNECSHAVRHGIAATFSSANRIVDNIIDQAEIGILADYSTRGYVIGNRVSRCTTGFSAERASDMLMDACTFTDVGTALRIWQAGKSPWEGKPWGEHHPMASRQYRIRGTLFKNADVAIDIEESSEVEIRGNGFEGVKLALKSSGTCKEVSFLGNNVEGNFETSPGTPVAFGRNHWASGGPPPGGDPADKPYDLGLGKPSSAHAPAVRGSLDAFLPKAALRGRRRILMDPFGPYDFVAPRLVPTTARGWGRATVEILGTPGPFSIEVAEGAVGVVPSEGEIPGTFEVSAPEGGGGPFRLAVQAGGQTLDLPGFLIGGIWDVSYYPWEPDRPGRPLASWRAVTKGDPVASLTTPDLDLVWDGSPPVPGIEAATFAVKAGIRLELPAGNYRVQVTSGDGIRIWLDSKRIFEDWTFHAPKTEEVSVTLKAGPHNLRIEHFQGAGPGRLAARLVP